MTTRKTEKQLDLALEGAIRDSGEFRSWLLRRTRFAGEDTSIVLTRSNWPWSRTEVRIWNQTSQEYDTLIRDGETDLLVVVQSKQLGRFAFHFENKLSGGSFTPYQADLYRARAAGWADEKKYGDYQEWSTVLVAPLAFYERNKAESQKFDIFISHEEVGKFIPLFNA